MKVLLISHNVFCATTSMGKTLKSYFDGWDVDDIAQLYIHSEIPTDMICHNYYRMTDKEIIKSIFTRRSGNVFSKNDINVDTFSSRVDRGVTASLYQKARKRTPFIYFARNLWWSLGKWKTKKLINWVRSFNPDIIFFASGDYAFLYKIALEIAQDLNIPLVVSCMDDYYFYNKNENKLGGKLIYKQFMKQVNKVMSYADAIFVICEKMGKDYFELFHKPCYTLCTPSSLNTPLQYKKMSTISYIGNLGLKRDEQLIKLGRALKNIQHEEYPNYIDVYSTESRSEILKNMNEENGIRFHGPISSKQVYEIMGKSMAVIHTESFDRTTRKQVRYSVSTKIADSLASGTCIIAYGPNEVASIEYLKEHNAAFCIEEDDVLEKALLKFLSNSVLREQIISNAIELAKENHCLERSTAMLQSTLQQVCQYKR